MLKANGNIKRVVIPVEGMHCASCHQRVEKAVNKMKGVSEASVNGVTNKAQVLYNADEIKVSDIVDTIVSTGYEPLVTAIEEEEEEALSANNEKTVMIPVSGMT